MTCSTGCSVCSSNTTCTTCNTNLTLNSATKKCDCSTGFYSFLGKCVTACPIGYFANSVTHYCDLCNTNC